MANFPFPPEIPSNLPSLQKWRIAAPISHRFQMRCHGSRNFESLKARVRWIKPREGLKGRGKKEITIESRNSLFAVYPTIAIAISSPFSPALCKQIGLPHQLDGSLRNSIRVRWYGGCVPTNQGINGCARGTIATWFTAIFRFLLVTLPSRRIESATGIHRFVHAQLPPSVCARSRWKGRHSPPTRTRVLQADTKNRDFIPVRRMELAASTLYKHSGTSFLQQFHEWDSVRDVKNRWLPFNISRALLCE